MAFFANQLFRNRSRRSWSISAILETPCCAANWSSLLSWDRYFLMVASLAPPFSVDFKNRATASATVTVLVVVFDVADLFGRGIPTIHVEGFSWVPLPCPSSAAPHRAFAGFVHSQFFWAKLRQEPLLRLSRKTVEAFFRVSPEKRQCHTGPWLPRKSWYSSGAQKNT
jgi:hypothetical protein